MSSLPGRIGPWAASMMRGEPVGQLDAAALDADEDQAVGAAGTFHDLQGHALEGTGHRGVVEKADAGGHAARHSSGVAARIEGPSSGSGAERRRGGTARPPPPGATQQADDASHRREEREHRLPGPSSAPTRNGAAREARREVDEPVQRLPALAPEPADHRQRRGYRQRDSRMSQAVNPTVM